MDIYIYRPIYGVRFLSQLAEVMLHIYINIYIYIYKYSARACTRTWSNGAMQTICLYRYISQMCMQGSCGSIMPV